MKTLCVLNKKGGVGKTTIASNLAQGIALLGQKVLLIDNDEQHNLTNSVGLNISDVTLADCFASNSSNLEMTVSASIREAFIENIYCISGSKSLENASPKRNAMKEILSTEIIQQQQYDFCIIDNSPAVSSKTKSAILASDFYLIPVQLKQFAIAGLREVFDSLISEYEIDPKRIFILANMYRDTIKRKTAVMAIKNMFPENTLKTIIPEDEAFDSMIIEEKSIYLSKSKCKGALFFQKLLSELFGFDEDDMFNKLSKKIHEYKSIMASANAKKAALIS
jgi:chromosome partitioning protein